MKNKLVGLYQIINKTNPLYLILLMIFLQGICHLKYLDSPPSGYHLWRQTQGLSVARNFYEESMNIFKPRVDSRGHLSGITGMEFPLVNYLTAILYNWFGFNHIFPRVIVLLFSFGGLTFCFLFYTEVLKNQFFGAFSAFTLVFSPLFGYYSFVMMPGIPMLCFLFGSLYFFAKWETKQKGIYFYFFLLSLFFAGLIKISSFLILPFFMWKIVRIRKNFKYILYHYLSIAIIVFMALTWYLYAMYLSKTFCNFDIRLKPEITFNIPIIIENIFSVLFQWLPAFYINIIQFILLIIGIYYLIRYKPEYLKSFFLFFFGGLLIFMSFFLPMLKIHDYFMIVSLPVWITMVVLGMKLLFKLLDKYKHISILIFFLILLIPIFGTLRFYERFENNNSEILIKTGKHLKTIIPNKKDLVIICGDESPCINLYFFNLKGWSIQKNIELNDFKKMIANGAKFLISSSRSFEERSDINQFLNLKSIYSKFNIYSLKLPLDLNSFNKILKILPVFSPIKITPKSIINNYSKLRKGLFYYKKGIFKEALAHLPKTYLGYFYQGLINGKLGLYQDAINQYKKSINLNPNYFTSYYNLGILYRKVNKFNLAVKIIKKGIKLNPSNASIHYLLAYIYFEMEEFYLADREFKKSITLNPKRAKPYFYMGIIHFESNRIQNAIKSFSKAHQTDPRFKPPHFLKSLCFLYLGDIKKAQREIRALKSFPNKLLCDLNHLMVLLKEDRLRKKNILHTYRKIQTREYFKISDN